jgi:hypothetical protein
MTTYAHPHQVVLLSSRFINPEHKLFFTRARLYLDRIELSGWLLGKKYEVQIPLQDLDSIDWQTDTSSAVFHLREGQIIRLKLPDLERWKQSVEQRLWWSAPGRFPMTSTSHTAPNQDLSLRDLVTFTTSMG